MNKTHEQPTQQKEVYGLWTSITMIVGIVIGSGIFFKADDILSLSFGNVLVAVILLVIGSLNIIFGALSLEQLQRNHNNNRGLISLFENEYGKKMAGGIAWFQAFVYNPSISVIIAWVSGIYTLALFNIDQSLELQIFLAIVYILFFHTLNLYSRKLGGYFQNITSLIKILPLIFVAVLGFFFAPEGAIERVTHSFTPAAQSPLLWLSALLPIAFSFDGWPEMLNIIPEIKNAKKNVRIALSTAPLIILFAYVTFFLGMNFYLGPEKILELGNDALPVVFKSILGEHGGALFLSVVLISILGVCNAVILSGIRLPNILAEKNYLSNKKFLEIDPQKQLSVAGSYLYLKVLLIWVVLHYLVMKFALLSGRDISEISIVFNYLLYSFLYFSLIKKFFKKENSSFFFAVVCPCLAISCCLLILLGSLIFSPLYNGLFLLACAGVTVAGYYNQVKQN